MSLFRTISDPLVLYLNNPKVAHFAFPLPDGTLRSLVGETYVIAFRRRILTTPLVAPPLPLVMSGDTLYATAAIPADAIAEINEVADGYLPISDLIYPAATAFAFGDTFSIDPATPGTIIKGGSQGLLRAIRADAVRVR